MTDKQAGLQHVADAVIHKLEEVIDRIKTACIEPDIDTADRLYKTALLDAMMNIATAIIPEDNIPPIYQKIREKYMQSV